MKPSGGRAFRAIEPLVPCLFKLHSAYNTIAGGGFFVQHWLYAGAPWCCEDVLGRRQIANVPHRDVVGDVTTARSTVRIGDAGACEIATRPMPRVHSQARQASRLLVTEHQHQAVFAVAQCWLV